MASQKHPIFDTATTLGKLVLFLGVSAICGLLAAGLMVPGVVLAGNTATGSINFFDELPDEMTVGEPAQSSRVLASDGSVIATFYSQNRTEVGLDAMSPFIRDAVVAVEDSRFYEHGGIDAKGLLRAVTSMARGGDRQGASTITQQYVNNVIVQTLEANDQVDQVKQGYDKGIGEKVREIKLAIALDKQYSKEEILQGYLNWVFFANGNYGIQSAASFYFGVSAADLTLAQSALLAGVVNLPSFYDPVTNPENAQSRRDMVLDRMLAQNMVDQAQYDEAIATPITLNIQQQKNGCVTAVRAEYFCQYVTNLILNSDTFGATVEERDKLLKQGGLTITTTLDPAMQDAAQAQLANFTPMENNPDKVGQALVTVQPGSGQILTMAQNTKIDAPEGQWSSDYNFSVDRFDKAGNSLGGAGGFDVGSTIKPFTFAEWLNAGHAVNEIVDASVRRYPATFNWTNSCGSSSGIYDSNNPNAAKDLQNAEGNFYQRVSAREGLYNSLNTATFATAAKLDLCNIQKMMTAAGIHQGDDPNLPYDLTNVSSLLGSGQVAPVTMASSFATFASGGVRCDPIALLSVTNIKGEAYPVPSANCEQTIRPEVAAGVVSVLQEVLVRGSGYQIGLGVPAGAKTGTTNLSEQTWTTGFTKGLSTTSWVGSPENKNTSNNGKLIANQRLSYVDGATFAGKAWQGYMTDVAGRFDTSAFPTPPNSILNPPAPIAPAPTAKPTKAAAPADDKKD